MALDFSITDFGIWGIRNFRFPRCLVNVSDFSRGIFLCTEAIDDAVAWVG